MIFPSEYRQTCRDCQYKAGFDPNDSDKMAIAMNFRNATRDDAVPGGPQGGEWLLMVRLD